MQASEIDDAQEDLTDAIKAFKVTPSADTLDDVYRATTAIETACRERLGKLKRKDHKALAPRAWPVARNSGVIVMQVALSSPDAAFHHLAQKTGLSVEEVAARAAPVIEAIEKAESEGNACDLLAEIPREGLMPVTEAQAETLEDAMYRWTDFAGLSQPEDEDAVAQAEEDRRQYPNLYVTNEKGVFVASGDRTARFLSAVTDIPYHVCLSYEYGDAASSFDTAEDVLALYEDALINTLAHNADGTPVFPA